MYTFRQAAAMCWGKLRRAFLIAFRKGRVEEKLRRRRGACHRCGACCKILFDCPAYDDSDGNPKCLIYNDRPGVCGLFPLDEKDLIERDIMMPEKPCGFTFEDAPNGNGRLQTGRLPEAMPIRWGPSPQKDNGKPKVIKGTLAIVWTYFSRRNGRSNGKS